MPRPLEKRGCHPILCGTNAQPPSLMRRSGILGRLGEQYSCETLAEALDRANRLVGVDHETTQAAA